MHKDTTFVVLPKNICSLWISLFSLKKFFLWIFFLWVFHCQSTFAQEDMSGPWIGYMVDLNQIKSENLPKIYTLRMLLKSEGNHTYRGIISKYWDQHYNTVSSVIGKYDQKKQSISFSEDQFLSIHKHAMQSTECKVITSLYLRKDINNNIGLYGKYYSLNSNLQSNECPVGTIHMERPLKDSSAFEYLSRYFNNPKESQIEGGTKEKEDIPFSPFYFPNIIISTNSPENLQTKLTYDVKKLLKSQKTDKKDTILWENENLNMVITPINTLADTLNILLDGIQLVSNLKLGSHSNVSLNIDFRELRENKIKEYVYQLYIVPLSWTDRRLSIKADLYDNDHRKIKSYIFDYSAQKNLNIPIAVRLK